MVIAVNGYVQPEPECRSAGMDETLTKPVQLEHLRAMLERFPPSAERKTA